MKDFQKLLQIVHMFTKSPFIEILLNGLRVQVLLVTFLTLVKLFDFKIGFVQSI